MDTTITVSTPVQATPRVLQMSSIFDVPVEQRASTTWTVHLPLEDRPWAVGLIVGPSGAGKSTIARHLFGEAILGDQQWNPAGALLDDFPGDLGIQEITGLLTSVGLGSPPAWMRPYATLSNGEQFRASMARALADTDGLVVVDEFTSVVDRQVARVASHTVQKAVRRSDRQLVAVTCHYDVIDWLQPDWVYDVAEASFAWRQVQPHPTLHLDIHRADRSRWPTYRRHHYLSARLHTSAVCYEAWADGTPVAFHSYLHFPHPRTNNIKMAHRLVVLPDWQGLGVGGRLNDWLGQHLAEHRQRFRMTSAHPAVIRQCSRSPRWRGVGPAEKSIRTSRTNRIAGGVTAGKSRAQHYKRQTDLRRFSTRSFEYQPPARTTRRA